VNPFYAKRVGLGWPLTGRSEELGLIGDAISDPVSSGVVLCGPAGVGKSRIVREALTAAESNQREIRWIVGTSSGRAVPLGAFAGWVGSAEHDNLRLVRDVVDSVTSTSSGDLAVIGVDDAHLLDDLSTFVIHQIVQRGAAKVLLTVRDGELIPAATQELWKAGQFDRLDVQPLARAGMTELVAASLGGCLDPDAAGLLWRLTGGNALYVRTIVEQELASGRLARQGASWRWISEPVLPRGLVELIEAQVGSLPDSVNDVIDVLAVGEPVELQSLLRITDARAVEDAERRGLIALEPVGGGMEARVAHPLYGEVRREGSPTTKLRRLRGLVAAELAKSDSGDDMRVAVRRATLMVQSDLEHDPDLLLRAARGAAWLADLPLTERLAAAAVRAGAGSEASFVRAHALSWLSRGQEADAVLREIDTDDLNNAGRARRLHLRACNLLWPFANPTAAKQSIDDIPDAAPPEFRSYIDAFYTQYWAAMGAPRAARKASADLALDQLPDAIAAGTAFALAISSGDEGRTTDAVAAADAGYAVADRSFGAAHMRFLVADGHVGALLLAGRIEDAESTAEGVRGQAIDLPGAGQFLSAGVAGRSALGAGRLTTAISLLEPLVDSLTSAGDTIGFGYRYQLALVVALAMRGAAEESSASLELLEERRHPSWQYLNYEHLLARAWVGAVHGAVSEAIATLLQAADTCCERGQFAPEVMCLQTATQFGDRTCAPRLRELQAIVEGPRVGLAASFAEALCTNDGAAMTVVSQDFERMGDRIAAIDAAAHSAVAHRGMGLRGSALGCAARAQRLAEQCGRAVTPALRKAAQHLPLTEREFEIVTMLVDGLSNREIAERLTVSVRTVESHVYNAMAKTGTSCRAELAAVLPGTWTLV
jgi:DNA-binding CsgD family transcriptional regulator